MFARVLEPRYAVEVFADGAAPLERLAVSPGSYALVLDWHLPARPGLEVCRFVRTSHDKLALAVLMLTVYGRKPDLVAGLTAGANDCVTNRLASAVTFTPQGGTVTRARGRRARYS